MERKFVRATFLLVSFILLRAGEAQGHGFGLFYSDSFNAESRQAGLSWDTCVAADRLFNYRMNLGFEWLEIEDDSESNNNGVLLDNTFGFRLLANEVLRLWAGPQVAVGIYDGNIGYGAGASLGSNLHLTEAMSLGLTAGVRAMRYEGVFGGEDSETIGFLRLDLFFRTPGDRFQKNP
jgi:hypothetical protein